MSHFIFRITFFFL